MFSKMSLNHSFLEHFILEQQNENSPLFLDGGRIRLRYDGLEIKQQGADTIVSLLWRGNAVSSIEFRAALDNGDVILISDLSGSAEIALK